MARAGLAKWYGDTDGTIVTAGSGNAYTLTTNNVHVALAAQSTLVFRADRANTGAATLNVDSLGAKSMKVNHSEELESGDIKADGIYVCVYNATTDIYEILGIPAPADGSITTAKLAAGAVTEAKVTSFPFTRAHLNGLGMTNGSADQDAIDHDIIISIGDCRDFANANNLSLTAALTKKISASWVLGDDSGGYGSASALAINTWYHVFLVDDGSGGVDAGFDASITATDLLVASGGSMYRRIGSVLTDSSSNIIAFYQNGDDFLWNAVQADWATATPGTTAVLRALSTPLGVRVKALVNTMSNSTAGGAIYLSSPDVSDQGPSFTGPITNAGHVRTSGDIQISVQVEVWTDASSQIRTRIGVNGDFRGSTSGWTDRRGRDD